MKPEGILIFDTTLVLIVQREELQKLSILIYCHLADNIGNHIF
jgi:hypothetical protein